MVAELFSQEALAQTEAFLRSHAAWAPPILFAMMVLEGIVVTTFLFSGTLFIVIAGVLIQAGVLGYEPVFAAVLAGYWLGDTISYELGRITGPRMRETAAVKARSALMAKAESLIERRGLAAILISRFMGPLRPFVTLLAGACRMERAAFHAATLPATALLVAGLLNAGMTGVQLLERLK